MKLGFIGVGKIACAVIEGLCTASVENLTINISPRNKEKSKHLSSTISNVHRMGNNQEVLNKSDIIFISLRPKDATDALNKLIFRSEHQVISVIPFLRLSDLRKKVEPAYQLSRAIPLPTVVNHNCPIPIFNSNKTITKIFSYIGQPLLIDDEEQLHVLWTLTGLITPFYDLLGELSTWSRLNGVEENIANKFIADMFQSLSYSAQITNPIDFNELSKHAATPNGMNEQAGKEIKKSGSHEAYRIASDNLLKRFLGNF